MADAQNKATDVETPMRPVDMTCMDVVLDFGAMCSIPHDTDEAGIRTFRALFFPKGCALHLPHRPGKYAVNGEWHMQDALSMVHFKQSTKRPAELLLSFMDYSAVSASLAGVYVESLGLPLQTKRNVYEETPRLTKITDVVGFTPIDAGQTPWSVHLKPALMRQDMFREFKIFSPKQMVEYINLPLSQRIEEMASRTQEFIDFELGDLEKQDKRLAQTRKAQFTARLEKVLNLIKDLPPEMYDLPLEERILSLEDLDPAAFSELDLKTPEKTSLASKSVERLVRTRFIEQISVNLAMRSVLEDEEANAIPDEPEVDQPEVSCGGSSTEPAPAVSNSYVFEKRHRKSTTPFDQPPPSKQVSTKRKLSAPVASDKRQEVNPRTGQPYARGPYVVKRVNVNRAVKTTAHAEEHVKAHSDLKEQLTKAKQWIAELEMQLVSLKQELSANKETHAISVAHAKLEASQSMSIQLLQKYQEGLQHGARLVAGRLSNPTPFADINGTPQSTSSWS